MWHLLVMLAKLLICSNHIAECLNATRTTKANAVTRISVPSNQHNNPRTWLRRQRRYLLFEKGSTVVVQGNIAKALLPEMPRGLNEIYEYTFNYELPTTFDLLGPKTLQPQSKQNTQTKATTISPTMQTPHLAALNVSGISSSNQLWLPQWHATPYWPSSAENVAPWWQETALKRQTLREDKEKQQQQQRRQQKQSSAHKPILSKKIAKNHSVHSSVLLLPQKEQRHSCSRRNIYGNQYHNGQKWCVASGETIGRVHERSSEDEGRRHVNANVVGEREIDDASHQIDESFDGFQFATNAERIFFDLMGKWAHVHNYPAQQCIMRTFCESRHLLATLGHSLFHDLLRIVIDAALPAAERQATYKKAIRHGNLNDCAQHYATLCGLSFLQHFTEAVHGRFM